MIYKNKPILLFLTLGVLYLTASILTCSELEETSLKVDNQGLTLIRFDNTDINDIEFGFESSIENNKIAGNPVTVVGFKTPTNQQYQNAINLSKKKVVGFVLYPQFSHPSTDDPADQKELYKRYRADALENTSFHLKSIQLKNLGISKPSPITENTDISYSLFTLTSDIDLNAPAINKTNKTLDIEDINEERQYKTIPIDYIYKESDLELYSDDGVLTFDYKIYFADTDKVGIDPNTQIKLEVGEGEQNNIPPNTLGPSINKLGPNDPIFTIPNLTTGLIYSWTFEKTNDTNENKTILKGEKTADSEGNIFFTKNDLKLGPTEEFNEGTFTLSITGDDLTKPLSFNLFYQPGIIRTWEDLQSINEYLSGTYTIVNDIVIPDNTSFTSIGTEGTPFTGSLEGERKGANRYSITANTGGTHKALFAVNDGIISDIILKNFNVTQESGTAAYAILVSNNKKTIKNIDILNSKLNTTSSNIGLIAGMNTGTVENIHISSSNINAQSGSTIGGVIGLNQGRGNLSARVESLTITSTNTTATSIGGLIGRLNSSVNVSVRGYISESTINVTNATSVGGIIGTASGSAPVQIYAYNNATQVNGKNNVGGLIGEIINVSTTLQGYARNTTSIATNTTNNNFIGHLVGKTPPNYTNANGYFSSNESIIKIANDEITDPTLIQGLLGTKISMKSDTSTDAFTLLTFNNENWHLTTNGTWPALAISTLGNTQPITAIYDNFIKPSEITIELETNTDVDETTLDSIPENTLGPALISIDADEPLFIIPGLKPEATYGWEFSKDDNNKINGEKISSPDGKITFTKTDLQLTELENYTSGTFKLTLTGDTLSAPVVIEIPYEPNFIYTWKDLQAVNQRLDGTYIIKNDIFIPKDSGFTSIGTAENPFTGIIKRDTSSNVKIKPVTTTDKITVSLFSVNEGTISGLTLEHFNITQTDIAQPMGALASINNGTITNVNLNNVKITGQKNIGVLIGKNNGSMSTFDIRNSTITNSNASTLENAGLLAGHNTENGTIKNITLLNSSVTLTKPTINVGYAIGMNEGSISSVKLGNYESRHKITTTSTLTNAGYFIGHNKGSATNITINRDIYRTQTDTLPTSIIGTGNNASFKNVGGFVGLNEASVSDIRIYKVNINSAGTMENVGAFVGKSTNGNISNITMTYPTIKGSLSGTNIGGFMGHYAGSQSLALNTNFPSIIIDGANSQNIGGVIGKFDPATAVTLHAYTDWGSINTPNATAVGGIIGLSAGTQSNTIYAYNNGTTLLAENSVGGLIGKGESSSTTVEGYSRNIAKLAKDNSPSTNHINYLIGETPSTTNITGYYSTNESKLYITNQETSDTPDATEMTITTSTPQTSFNSFTFTTNKWSWIADGSWPALNVSALPTENQITTGIYTANAHSTFISIVPERVNTLTIAGDTMNITIKWTITTPPNSYKIYIRQTETTPVSSFEYVDEITDGNATAVTIKNLDKSSKYEAKIIPITGNITDEQIQILLDSPAMPTIPLVNR